MAKGMLGEAGCELCQLSERRFGGGVGWRRWLDSPCAARSCHASKACGSPGFEGPGAALMIRGLSSAAPMPIESSADTSCWKWPAKPASKKSASASGCGVICPMLPRMQCPRSTSAGDKPSHPASIRSASRGIVSQRSGIIAYALQHKSANRTWIWVESYMYIPLVPSRGAMTFMLPQFLRFAFAL